MKYSLFNVVDPGERNLVRKLASTPLPMGKGRSLVDVSKEVGSKLGINPNMLASSSLVEGVNQLFTKGGSALIIYSIPFPLLNNPKVKITVLPSRPIFFL